MTKELNIFATSESYDECFSIAKKIPLDECRDIVREVNLTRVARDAISNAIRIREESTRDSEAKFSDYTLKMAIEKEKEKLSDIDRETIREISRVKKKQTSEKDRRFLPHVAFLLFACSLFAGLVWAIASEFSEHGEVLDAYSYIEEEKPDFFAFYGPESSPLIFTLPGLSGAENALKELANNLLSCIEEKSSKATFDDCIEDVYGEFGTRFAQHKKIYDKYFQREPIPRDDSEIVCYPTGLFEQLCKTRGYWRKHGWKHGVVPP